MTLSEPSIFFFFFWPYGVAEEEDWQKKGGEGIRQST